MTSVVKVVVAALAALGALGLGAVSLVSLVYALSSELPTREVGPTLVAGLATGALALALTALAVWLVASALKAPPR